MPSLDLTAGGRVTSLKTQKSRVGLAALLAAFLISVCMVDPIRETAKDDDWAYALTVQRLLEKGTYELHEWSTASMPAQIIWGALFSGALGFSFSALRLSTLALMLGGLIAFYSLFVNRGWADPNAALLVTVLFASPLVLLLSFSFMTDVPFLAWILITMAGCDHAIRGNTRSGMLVASVPASFAILTRQFGAVLPASFALVALLERKSRRLLMPFLLLPTLATTWQAFTMIEDPTASMSDDLGRQVAFAADPLSLASEIPWRATVLFQYMGVFLLPMAPLLIYVAWRRGLSRIAVAAIAAGALYGALAKGLIMPSLPYNLSASANRVPGLPMVMTIASTLLGAILAQALAQPLRQFTRLATPKSCWLFRSLRCSPFRCFTWTSWTST